jgi:hypothetical protein
VKYKLHHRETIYREGHYYLTFRTAVPGGWLYETIYASNGVALQFVPDPNVEIEG